MGVELIKLKELKFNYLNRKISLQKDYDWDSLTDSIKTNGFIPEKYGYITISKDGMVLNGHHRCVVLKKLYHDDYEVKVFRKKFNYTLSIIFPVIFLVFFVLPIKTIKNGFKYFNSHRTNKKKISQ